jgi:hypothetical protein
MRKLSMKNAGTPAIEVESDSGSGGVSADGFGARLPRLGLATAFAPAVRREPPGLALARVCAAPPPAGVLPWAL